MPIRIVVPFPPGGASDIVARIVGEQLVRKPGQPVLVDNRPGAGGSIGSTAVAVAPADGHTLLLANPTPITIGRSVRTRQAAPPPGRGVHPRRLHRLGAERDLADPKAGLNSVADIVREAKARGRLDFGSGGPASIGHIYGEMRRAQLGINLVHIPHRGGAPMTTDVIAGTMPVGIDVLTACVPYFKSGQIKALAVTGSVRSALVPDVPTIGEADRPKLVSENVFGISAPAKIPKDVSDRLHQATAEVLALPEIESKLAELGIATRPMTQAEFACFVQDQVQSVSPVVKAAAVRP